MNAKIKVFSSWFQNNLKAIVVWVLWFCGFAFLAIYSTSLACLTLWNECDCLTRLTVPADERQALNEHEGTIYSFLEMIHLEQVSTQSLCHSEHSYLFCDFTFMLKLTSIHTERDLNCWMCVIHILSVFSCCKKGVYLSGKVLHWCFWQFVKSF